MRKLPKSEGELLDAFAQTIKAPEGRGRESAIARALGVSKQHVHHVRIGTSHLSEHRAQLVAEALELPYAAVLAIIAAARAHRPEARRAFRTLARFACGASVEQPALEAVACDETESASDASDADNQLELPHIAPELHREPAAQL